MLLLVENGSTSCEIQKEKIFTSDLIEVCRTVSAEVNLQWESWCSFDFNGG